VNGYFRRTFEPFALAFANARVAIMLPLGFASGLPLMLTGSTLTAWMDSVGVDLTTIGFFAWVSLPYNFKFLWAPLLDRYSLPWLSRRRDWMLATQVGLAFGVAALGCLDPTAVPVWVAGAALVVAFLSASQDVVIDAYRTDVLLPRERAAGVAVFVAVYRLALIVAGAGALILSDRLSWRVVYLVLGGLMLLGVLGTVLAPAAAQPARQARTLPEAVWRPLSDFFKRPGAVLVLIVVTTFKVGDSVASQMMMPFLLNADHGLGFGRAEVGAIVKGLGLGASIAGALLGGGVVARIGLRRSLLVFGLLQAVANVLYTVLAVVGRDHTMLVVAIGADNLCNGLGTAAFVAFLMSLCSTEFSATQYALLSSASTIVGRLLSGASGWIAGQVGWPVFFLLTLAAAMPALLLLLLVPFDRDEGKTTLAAPAAR
jgi:PAT family beta-lactamase induction signal transducer AmpG